MKWFVPPKSDKNSFLRGNHGIPQKLQVPVNPIRQIALIDLNKSCNVLPGNTTGHLWSGEWSISIHPWGFGGAFGLGVRYISLNLSAPRCDPTFLRLLARFKIRWYSLWLCRGDERKSVMMLILLHGRIIMLFLCCLRVRGCSSKLSIFISAVWMEKNTALLSDENALRARCILLFCMRVPPSRTFNFITTQTREILMRRVERVFRNERAPHGGVINIFIQRRCALSACFARLSHKFAARSSSRPANEHAAHKLARQTAPSVGIFLFDGQVLKNFCESLVLCAIY